jgi:hypothetical protein
MPVSTSFVVREIGSIKGSLGRFVLGRNGCQPVTIRTIGREIAINIQANTSAQQLTAGQLVANRPSLPDVLGFVEPGYGVALLSGMLPFEFFNLFLAAGEQYQKDLKTYCSSLFLLPGITNRSGASVAGFEVSMAKAPVRELLQFMSLANPAFGHDINTAIFINIPDASGEEDAYDQLMFNFSQLVGRTKLSVYMSNHGIKDSQLGEKAQDYFGHWYRFQMFAPLLKALSLQHPDTGEYNQGVLRNFKSDLDRSERAVSQMEREILKPLMTE